LGTLLIYVDKEEILLQMSYFPALSLSCLGSTLILPDYNWILKFADDTKIFSQITDDNDWKALLDDLLKLTTWSERWQMLFNASKCKVMHVGK